MSPQAAVLRRGAPVSAELSALCWKKSRATGLALDLLLWIAQRADDSRTVQTTRKALARALKVRQDTIQGALVYLDKWGEVTVEEDDPPRLAITVNL
jgi:hypothetical protein